MNVLLVSFVHNLGRKIAGGWIVYSLVWMLRCIKGHFNSEKLLHEIVKPEKR